MGANADSESAGRFVYVVDDDRDVRVSLSFQLSTLGYRCEPFGNAGDFLDALDRLAPACILLDIRMPQVGGMQVLASLKERGIDWPTIVMTGHADVQIAVAAMKSGAIEFLEKPFEEDMLVEALDRGAKLLDEREQTARRNWDKNGRLETLSAREREVLQHLTAGEQNKLIAHALGLSVRTIEMHRANLFAKLGVRSVAEAVAFGLKLD